MWRIGINVFLFIFAVINQIIAVAAAIDKNYTDATYFILVAIYFLLFAIALPHLNREK
jgi:hypothetical protein